MLSEDDTVVVASSGGADSTCLLDVLARVPLGLTLHVAHIDHGLAERSDEIARAVATKAAQAGFDVHVMRAPDLAGPNLQARARELRYGFLEAVAAQVGARRIATGHTLDDRVETTIARLVHGAGTEGLAGIPPAEGSRIRPLLDVRRAETRSYCAERALEYSDDPANSDPRFERTFVRQRVVPVVEERWGDGGVRAIATSAQRLREDADALGLLAERVSGDVVTGEAGPTELDLQAMLKMPRALRRRMLEKAVGRVRDRSGGIDAALDALERPLDRPRRFAVASGAEISLEADRMEVTRSSTEARPHD